MPHELDAADRPCIGATGRLSMMVAPEMALGRDSSRQKCCARWKKEPSENDGVRKERETCPPDFKGEDEPRYVSFSKASIRDKIME